MAKVADSRKTLVYCRESRDENGMRYERIETQRDMLLDFCKKKGLFNIVSVIMDDDVSGTGFERLERVASMAERGEVEVVVFKDASRLGRNLRGSLNFTHLMERLGVELMFESESYDEDFFPLKAWFNEQRAKEDSKKVRAVLRRKMETGELLIKPPYGYKRKESGGMEPDPAKAAVVAEIFSLKLAGFSTGEIAHLQNQRGVPPPSPLSKGWNRQHILRITGNDVYTGTMRYGKVTTVSYKDKRQVRTPESAHIVLKNRHEPIVCEEDFARANEGRSARRPPRRPGALPFSGLLLCGGCGAQMVHKDNGYVCGAYHKNGRRACSAHGVSDAFLQEQAEKIGAQFKKSHKKTEKNAEKGAEEELSRILALIYDDRLRGLISEETFLKKRAEYGERLEKTKTGMSAAQPDIPVKMLFKKIVVYEPGEGGRGEKEAVFELNFR